MTNKSGRNVDDIARDYDEEAIKVFAEVMRDEYAENRDRLRAAENLVERGHGKAVTPIEVRPGGKKRDALAALSEDALYDIVNRATLPRLTREVMEAEVVEAEFEVEVDWENDPLLQ